MISFPAEAQLCPLYPPEAIGIRVTGETSQCQNFGDCAAGEVIDFEVLTANGRPTQTCDIVEWTFGDGATATVTGTPKISHVFPTTWRTHTYMISMKVSNGLGASPQRSAQIIFREASCIYPRPQADSAIITASYTGTISRCATGYGKCAVGEPIEFTFAASSPSLMPCDKYTIDWGDGTDIQRFEIVDPIKPIVTHHFFAVIGDFTVTAAITDPNPPPIQLREAVGIAPFLTRITVPVTKTGELPPPRHRAARH